MRRSLIVAFMLALSAFFAERANAQTVSARGSGTVGGFSDCFSCSPTISSSGGKGVSFNFSFSGSLANEMMGQVPSTGVFNAVDKETNIQLAYSGPATITPTNHSLLIVAMFPNLCFVTTPDGKTEPAVLCSVIAKDNTSNGMADEILFMGLLAPNGDLGGCGGITGFPCTPMASGNINID